VDLGTTQSICGVQLDWEAAYASAFQIQTSNDNSSWTTIYSTTTGTGGDQNLSVSGSGRYIRMYGTARATGYGYSLWEFDVYAGATPATTTTTPGTTAGSTTTTTPGGACGTADLALNQPTTASSLESGSQYPASAATDGNLNTRWSSAYSDPQWLQVDLGATKQICQVAIDWQNPANATAFQIQTSNDASTWTTIYATTTSTGGSEVLPVSGSGRYVRMYGTARASGYGYSIWEFDVYGTGSPTTTSTSSTTTPSSTTSSTTVPATTTTTTGSTATWTPLWTPSFAGAANTAPSASDWIEDTGTGTAGGPAQWGTGEVETMSNSTNNVHLDGNGHLDLTALESNGAWTSGRIESQQSGFAAPAGGQLMITASIQQPDPANGLGYWPAFWTLGSGERSGGTWPSVGEGDIMEDVNGLSSTAETLHCGVDPNGPCNEPDGDSSGFANIAGAQTGYHTYTEIIDRTTTNEQIRWYVDNEQVWQVSESQVGAATWQAAVDHGFFIIFDLAIGGAFPNAVCGCTSPSPATTSGGTMSIASVGVYQSAGSGSLPPPYVTPPVPSGGSVVKVTGTQGNWGLSVNGTPYYIKGVTWGPDNSAALAYMPNLQAMGVNTIRNWGTDATSQPLLDAAARYGIKVINGFWLNYGTDWVADTSYEQSEEQTILQYVNEYKNDPAVLMWDIGNEVILNLAAQYSGTQLQAETQAYLQYVDQVAQAIHAADPNHPVTSTEAYRTPTNFEDYEQYAPDLDLYAMNAYGPTCSLYSAYQSAGNMTKPFIVTETAGYGEWEAPNDANGVPLQETDAQNAAGYATSWGCITAHPTVELGATMFSYGIQNDFGGVWYNMIAGGWYRPSYYEVASLYGGSVGPDAAPQVANISVSNDSAVPAGSQLTLSASATSPEGYPLHYNVMFSDKYLTTPDGGDTGLHQAQFTQTGTDTFSVGAPKQVGVWKVYLYASDGHGNAGIDQESFNVVPPPVSGTDLALGKPTTASSEQDTSGSGCPCTAADATDGNLSTRWASAWSDPQWLEVDLGSVQTLHTVQLVWENGYATAYQIQVSADGTTWTTVYSTTAGQGGVETLSVAGASGRYVRFYGTARGTAYGYSLWEMGVY
jgi:hypothetical protein